MATTIEEHNGWTFEIKDKEIQAVTAQGLKFKLGDQVVSSGNMLAKGAIGKIEKIYFPYTNGLTTDILFCRFGKKVSFMKFKDLEPPK